MVPIETVDTVHIGTCMVIPCYILLFNYYQFICFWHGLDARFGALNSYSAQQMRTIVILFLYGKNCLNFD
jgi:hypothetical protein